MLDIIPQRSKTIKVGNILDAINFSLGLNLIWKTFLHCYKFFLWCKISPHKKFFHGSNSTTRNISTLGHNQPLSQNTPLTFNTPILKIFQYSRIFPENEILPRTIFFFVQIFFTIKISSIQKSSLDEI